MIKRTKQFIVAPIQLKKAIKIIEGLNPNFETMEFDDKNHIIFAERNGLTCSANVDEIYEIASTETSGFNLEAKLDTYIITMCNWF